MIPAGLCIFAGSPNVSLAGALWRVGDAAAAVISPSCVSRLTPPSPSAVYQDEKLAGAGGRPLLTPISSPLVAKLRF